MINEALETDRAYQKDKADAYERGYKQGQADAKPHWIPVIEKLPNIGESVLVTFDTEEVCEMKLWEIKGVAQYWCNPYDGYTYEFDRIIAWMPLPEHYKGVTTPPECEGDCGWCKSSVIEKCKVMTE